MLTPGTINTLIQKTNKNYSKPRYGVYSPFKQTMNYIAKQINEIDRNEHFTGVEKVTEMINLLEGFIRYVQDYNTLLLLEFKKLLIYIYYPDTEDNTLKNRDNLLVGSKGQTVLFWHDAYFENNRAPIINRFFDCKNIMYTRNRYEYLRERGKGMPEQMQKQYEIMLSKHAAGDFKSTGTDG